jgi:hypothetical protein
MLSKYVKVICLCIQPEKAIVNAAEIITRYLAPQILSVISVLGGVSDVSVCVLLKILASAWLSRFQVWMPYTVMGLTIR